MEKRYLSHFPLCFIKPHKINIVVIEMLVSIVLLTAKRTNISVIFHLPKSQLDRRS